MVVSVTVVAVFAVSLLSFAEGNVISRRQSSMCSNASVEADQSTLFRCSRSLSQVWLLAGRPDALEEIQGHLSTLCTPPCVDPLRQNFIICGPPGLSTNVVDGALSFYCGSGPGGVPCLPLVNQEQGRALRQNLDSACPAGSATNCSSSCSAALDSLAQHNGCCLGSQIAFNRASSETTDPGPPPDFEACNVPLPEACSSTRTGPTGMGTDSGESALQPVISLVILAGLLAGSLL